uniref:Uncharacterized protein n=1 Tax=Trichuris muris TaxID=70415 RepID=A0A5S6QCL2_TRIMR
MHACAGDHAGHSTGVNSNWSLGCRPSAPAASRRQAAAPQGSPRQGEEISGHRQCRLMAVVAERRRPERFCFPPTHAGAHRPNPFHKSMVDWAPDIRKERPTRKMLPLTHAANEAPSP